MYAIYLPHPSRCVRERGGGERKRQTDKRVLGTILRERGVQEYASTCPSLRGCACARARVCDLKHAPGMRACASVGITTTTSMPLGYGRRENVCLTVMQVEQEWVLGPYLFLNSLSISLSISLSLTFARLFASRSAHTNPCASCVCVRVRACV